MRRFIIKAVLFLTLLSSVIAIWEYQLGKVTNSYSKKRKQFESKLPSIEVLVLGASQLDQGVNPAYINMKCYNLSTHAQSLFYDKELALKYIDRLPALKAVFIEVTFFSLWYEMNGKEYWRKYFYYQFWNIKYPDFSPTDLNLYSKIVLYAPMLPLTAALKPAKVNMAEDISPDGWYMVKESLPITDTMGKRMADDLYYQCNDISFKSNIQYLKTLITELDKRNIKVVLITPPVTRLMDKYANKRKIAITDSVLNAFTAQYNCKFMNYWQDKRFVDSDFYNADHLNVRGAEKFSKILNTEVLMDSTLAKKQ